MTENGDTLLKMALATDNRLFYQVTALTHDTFYITVLAVDMFEQLPILTIIRLFVTDSCVSGSFDSRHL